MGLSGGKLAFEEPDGRCLPRSLGPAALPAVCYEACPQVHASYPAMNRAVFPDSVDTSPFFGHYRRILVAHSTDECVRRSAASGGVLTAVLIHLLESQRISGAVALAMDPGAPGDPSPSSPDRRRRS